MFKSFYGMTFNPFDKSLPESYAFKSKDHEQMLSRLEYLKNARGIGLFTAPPGSGKTFTLRCFSKSLNPNLYQLSYICLSTVSVTEFYQQFCHEALKQRIVVHYNCEGLSVEEAKNYIYLRIELTGAARSIIDESAVHAVANFCQGTPRIINSVMTNALILGSQLKKNSIDSEVILSACNSLSLS